jgi:hypothetical protein
MGIGTPIATCYFRQDGFFFGPFSQEGCRVVQGDKVTYSDCTAIPE